MTGLRLQVFLRRGRREAAPDSLSARICVRWEIPSFRPLPPQQASLATGRRDKGGARQGPLASQLIQQGHESCRKCRRLI